MSARTDKRPTVPLQSAAGPENPPCPACENPLFPWVAEPWREAEAVLRCEVCGLGIAQAGGSPEEAKAVAAEAAESGAPNRASFAAWMGSGAWAGLEPGRRYLLTPDSVGRLQPQAAQPRPRLSIALMWQTLQ